MKIQTLPEELSIDSLSDYPRRIVCLTDETTETLYLLGEDARIAGVSGYTVRPKEARSKPRVSAFVSAKIDKIEELRPDLVLAFSDLQADIVRELIQKGLTVLTFNQRSVAEILQMILTWLIWWGVRKRGERSPRSCRAGWKRFGRRRGAFLDGLGSSSRSGTTL